MKSNPGVNHDEVLSDTHAYSYESDDPNQGV